jgi:hypothetical protein
MLTPARDREPASWIVESLHGLAEDVGSIVPPGFAAYLRLFHRASMAGRQVTWSEVAEANGRTAHPEMQFHALSPGRSAANPDEERAYFWWPEDRKWCVATEIDFMSTYVGASRVCAGAILKIEGIEAMSATNGDGITAAGDTVNPNPHHPDPHVGPMGT